MQLGDVRQGQLPHDVDAVFIIRNSFIDCHEVFFLRQRSKSAPPTFMHKSNDPFETTEPDVGMKSTMRCEERKSQMPVKLVGFYNEYAKHCRDGYDLLEEVLGLETNSLRRLYYYNPMCSLRRLSRIVRLEGASLPWGMLLFSKSLRTIWFISPEGLIQQFSLAKALTVIAFTNAPCFLIVRHRFCRKGRDFRVLTPIYFPPQTILPTWHAKPYLTHFLENGWIRIETQRPSLELPAGGYGEMEFSLLLPNIGQNVQYASI